MIPLLSTLLCLAQRETFLNQWSNVLQACFACLKGSKQDNRAPLNAIYRLVSFHIPVTKPTLIDSFDLTCFGISGVGIYRPT